MEKKCYIQSAVALMFHFSAAVRFLMNLTGLPAHSCPVGISLPGGTTEFGPIMHSSDNFAPSRITLLGPTQHFMPISQLTKVHPGFITVWFDIQTTAGRPVGSEATVLITQFCMIVTFPAILTTLISPRITTLSQMFT